MLGNMPWQYVNFMNCMVFGEEGMRGGGGYHWGL